MSTDVSIRNEPNIEAQKDPKVDLFIIRPTSRMLVAKREILSHLAPLSGSTPRVPIMASNVGNSGGQSVIGSSSPLPDSETRPWPFNRFVAVLIKVCELLKSPIPHLVAYNEPITPVKAKRARKGIV